MYIWAVCLELDWSFSKGEWEDNVVKTVAAKTAEDAYQKAKKLVEREFRPWKNDEGETHYVFDMRLVSIERGNKIDG